MPDRLAVIGVLKAAEAKAAAAVSGEAVLLRAGALALLCVSPETAPDRAARIRLAARACDALEAFLPLSPSTVGPAAARDWLAGRAARIEPALARAAGAAEWIVSLDAPAIQTEAPEAGARGRGWLRARAAEAASMRAAAEEAAQTLDALAGDVAGRLNARAMELRLAPQPGADLRLRASRRDAGFNALLRARAAAHAPAARVAGPFPPYGAAEDFA